MRARSFQLAADLPPSRPILLVAHGQRGLCRTNKLFLSMVGSVKRELTQRDTSIRCEAALLRGAPGFSNLPESFIAARPIIYPFFMTNGYFTKSALPRALSEAFGYKIQNEDMLSPFGASRHFVTELDRSLAKKAGNKPFKLHLLAHGTARNPASATSTYRLAETLANRHLDWEIDASFLDQAPYFSQHLPKLGRDHTILPLFTNPGLHAVDELKDFRIKNPAPDFLPPIGTMSWVPSVIARDCIEASKNWQASTMPEMKAAVPARQFYAAPSYQ